jgi:hypothetical protein
VNASSEFKDLPDRVRPANIWLSCYIYESQLLLRVRYTPEGESRSETLWERSVERPPGKTLAECVEAALYRLARAGSDGLLVPPGWDSL